MIINYLKIAFRNISRNKGYTFINVAGLSVGLAVCFLIILFVRAELSVDRFYRAEDRFAEMFNFFSFLAIFISCLGLLGLATYVAERRTKEIGIRKVLGAGIPGIITLIVKDFLKLVIIAVVISTPVGFYIMNRWLEDFAYRIEIGLWIFALTFMIVLIIAIVTVGFQTIRAAIANPVDSLRYE